MHLLFSVLFPLSVLRLWTNPLGNRLWGGAIWLATFFLLINLLKKKEYFNYNTAEKITRAAPFQAAALVIACWGFFLSTFWNLPSIYQHRPLSIILLVSNLACYAFFAMILLLFHGTRTKRFFYLALSIITAVHVLALLAVPLFPWVKKILEFTMGHLFVYPGKIHSVFQGTTIYGPFAALTAIGLGLSALKMKNQDPGIRFATGAAAIIAAAGCLLCPCRTGLITFFAGFFISLLFLPAKIKSAGVILCLLFVMGIHVAAYNNKFMRYKLGKNLPYIVKLTRPSTIKISDFKIRINAPRLKIFRRAVELWKTSPWIGIGPGQFNIRSGFKWTIHTHNVYLGILCENGLMTFIPLILLFLWLLVKFWGSITGVLLSMLAVMWCTEILIEHSCPFILGSAWLLMWTNYLERNIS